MRSQSTKHQVEHTSRMIVFGQKSMYHKRVHKSMPIKAVLRMGKVSGVNATLVPLETAGKFVKKYP